MYVPNLLNCNLATSFILIETAIETFVKTVIAIRVSIPVTICAMKIKENINIVAGADLCTI
jgi:hypothetical protein